MQLSVLKQILVIQQKLKKEQYRGKLTRYFQVPLMRCLHCETVPFSFRSRERKFKFDVSGVQRGAAALLDIMQAVMLRN